MLKISKATPTFLLYILEWLNIFITFPQKSMYHEKIRRYTYKHKHYKSIENMYYKNTVLYTTCILSQK